MKLGRIARSLAAAALVLSLRTARVAGSEIPDDSRAPYGAWKNGPPADASYFPIAVWLQDPKNAAKYQAAGINLYVGLWKGPTEGQLDALRAAGMQVICEQNRTALGRLSDRTIVAWMHGDEPDNAQELPGKKGYGPPILPEKIIADYQKLRAADPTRPVLLNLGQGVAWDGWYGRGVRSNHPEDYREYAKGGDIVSFDIYPATHDRAEVRGNLWYVPKGVERLREWAGPTRTVWNCIECTPNGELKPTPAQVRSEVWMALVHGSRGLIYFVHQFKPKFIEAGLLADPEMLAAVTKLNREIRELAPVLNSPTLKNVVAVKSSDEKVPIDILVKRHGGATYLFAVSLRDAPAKASFAVKGLPEKAEAEVLGEGRKIAVGAGKFDENLEGYAVRIFRIR